MRGQKCRDGVAKTLEEVKEYASLREEKLRQAADLRAKAAQLEAEAAALLGSDA